MNTRLMRSRLVTLATAAVLLTTANAQAPEGTSSTEAVAVEVFNAPQGIDLKPPEYPIGERFDENEGWVTMNFMVDPSGKPYEISVADSTGNKRFEEIAVKTASEWRFQPATLNGLPIDAGHQVKVTFRLTDGVDGARGDFVRAYRKAVRAIEAKDRAAADEALAKLKITNLYEDAFANIARFSYAREWLDKAHQLGALQRAIAHEQSESYLPKATFRKALVAMLQLQVEMQDYAGFLDTWETAQKSGVPSETLAYWEPTIAKVKALRSDDRAYAVNAAFGDATSWHYKLYKKHFRMEVKSGRLAEIKLRCEKRYVFFRFDPTLQYAINERFGSCEMEAIGDPGTQFVLIQS